MKNIFLFFVVLLFISFSSVSVALVDNGDGTITDTDTNLTWFQNANVSGTMTWYEAMGWASALVYAGHNDWRLPITDMSCSGYNCDTSEMGNLFYANSINSESWGPFLNVESRVYWSLNEVDEDSNRAWRFNFDVNSGYQGKSLKTSNRNAWAVRNIQAVSEPIGSLLFLIGGLTLAFRRFRKKRQ